MQNKRTISGLIGSMVGTLALSAATAAGPAFAQTVPGSAPATEGQSANTTTSTLKEVVVTGTLIRGIAPVGTEVTTLDAQNIQDAGVVSTQDLLSTLPQVTNAFNQVLNANSGVNGLTIVRPNIHNIGAAGGNTTLVLVDGHDIVGAGILQTTPDAGIIPPSVLQRVDVVADGGSAIYGADAVGGIVNFITRKRMEGVEADAHYGWGNEYSASDANVTAGHTWDSGSILLAYSYRQNTDLLGADRPYFRQNLTPFGGSDNRVTQCPLANVSAGGVSYAMPSLVAGTLNQCDQALVTDIFPAETQNSVYASFTQDLASSVTFDFTAYWTGRATDRLSPQITSTGTITNTNPYFIPVGGATSETVQYSYAPAAGNTLTDRTGIHEFGVTPELRFTLGGGWTLDTLLYAGRSITTAHSPEINAAADANALAGTTVATALDPYDIAVTNESIVSQVLRYEQYATNTQSMVELKALAQGPVLRAPGGNVRLAVGAQYEYQNEDATQTDAPFGDLAGAAHSSADLVATSAFGELLIPIVGADNSVPGVRSLDLDAQGRLDHYNRFGNTVNPKVGFSWRPVESVTIRGSYGTSFVAPSLADLSGSVDYRAQVVPVSPFGPGAFNIRPTILLAGGGDVKPMTSKNYSIGADLRPSGLPSNALSLTYWNTEVDGLINVFPFYAGAYYFASFPNQYVVNPTLAQAEAIIGSERMQGPSLAQLYSNPATYPYAILDAERTNLGNQYVSGIDFDWRFRHRTSFGAIMASASGTYVLMEDSKQIDGPRVTMLTAGNNISRLLYSASFGALVGNLTSRATVYWSSGFPVDVPGQTWVGAFHPVNLLFSYDLGRHFGAKELTMSLNVDNVANETPSFENSANLNGVGNGATLGRFFNLGVHAAF